VKTDTITHCPQGHPYDEANTYQWSGNRYCKICHKAHSLAYARKISAAKPKRPTEAERFWTKVDDRMLGPGGCWLWTAAIDKPPNDYGYFQRSGGLGTVRAHRHAHEHMVGPIPDGMTLDHRMCRVKKCVNPAHLILCTQSENCSQPDGGGGRRKAQTHCKRGHDLSTHGQIRQNGTRYCKRCESDRKAILRYSRVD
jgi:hypothetical protein